jgi:hypothetical protein
MSKIVKITNYLAEKLPRGSFSSIIHKKSIPHPQMYNIMFNIFDQRNALNAVSFSSLSKPAYLKKQLDLKNHICSQFASQTQINLKPFNAEETYTKILPDIEYIATHGWDTYVLKKLLDTKTSFINTQKKQA